MRYRQLGLTGDYLFGQGASWLVNSPAAVAQAISTRLKLFTGEWFLDNRVGLDLNQILGNNTAGTRDLEVKTRIAETLGVADIASYASNVEGRVFTVTALVNTIYGQVTITESF